MQILIVNQHTCNRGDEAAGRAVIESLLQAFPDSKINVLYRFNGIYPPIAKDTDKVKHYPEIKYKYNKKFLISLYLEIFFNFILLFLGSKNFFIGPSGQIYKKIMEADIVVNAPTGPNIGDIYNDKLYLLTLIFSVLARKKTVMYGSSVGPFNNKILRFWSKFLFNKMTFVCVRENISLQYLKDLQLTNKNIYSSIDAAIQKNICTDNAEELFNNSGLQLNKINIGITPLGYQWYPMAIRNEKSQIQIENNIAYIINKITENNDTNVYFFPQIFSFSGKNFIEQTDIPIINNIINKVDKPYLCKIIPAEYDSDMQQAMISKLDYFIGMRYHSIIFSIKMLIPVIGIYYEHKAVGFLEKIGLENLAVKIQDFLTNPDIVLEKIQYIKQNSSTIKLSIKNNLPKIKELSAFGTKLIKKYVEEENK